MSYSTNNQTKKDIEFINKSLWIYCILYVVNFSAWKFLAVTTGFMAYSLLETKFNINIPEDQLFYARILGVFLFYLIIDAGLQSSLRYYFREKMSTSSNNTYKSTWIKHIAVLILIRLIATTTSSLWIAPEMADAMTDDANPKYYATQIDKIDSLQRVREIEMKQDIKELKASALSNVDDAGIMKSQRVIAAIKSGDVYQRESFAQIGFAWLESADNSDSKDHKYAAKIRNAMEEERSARAAQAEKVQIAEANLLKLQSDTTANNQKSFLTGVALNEIQDVKAEEKSKGNIIIYLDIFCLFVGVWTTRLMVIREQAAGLQPKQKTLLSTLSKSFDDLQNKGIGLLESILGQDINGDGHIGNPDHISTSNLSVSVAEEYTASIPIETRPVRESTPYEPRTTPEIEVRTVVREPEPGERVCANADCNAIFRYNNQAHRFCQNKCRAKWNRAQKRKQQ